MGMKVNERERACEGGDEREKVAWWSGQYEMGMAMELVRWMVVNVSLMMEMHP